MPAQRGSGEERRQCPLGSGVMEKGLPLMGHSHHYSAWLVCTPVSGTGADLFSLPCGAPWHPGPPAPPWPSARPRRVRRAAGAGLTMHHRALCVLALGTLGKDGGGAQRAWGTECP